jgi:hypothetical protein
MARDAAGQNPLHLAAQVGLILMSSCCTVYPTHWLLHCLTAAILAWLQCALPMCSYQLASRAPAACLERDGCQQTPVDLALASAKGEVRQN